MRVLIDIDHVNEAETERYDVRDEPAALGGRAARRGRPLSLSTQDQPRRQPGGWSPDRWRERLRRERPQTPVLIMSGYAQPILAGNGILDPRRTPAGEAVPRHRTARRGPDHLPPAARA